MTLDSIIDTAIPWIIGIGGALLIYRQPVIKEAIDRLFGWIKSIIERFMGGGGGDSGGNDPWDITNQDIIYVPRDR